MNYESFVSAVEGLALKYQRMNSDMCVSVNRTDYGLELTCMPKEQMRKVIVVYFNDYWGDHYGYGISKCSPTDVFDEDVGMAVAFAHFRGYPIPDFI